MGNLMLTLLDQKDHLVGGFLTTSTSARARFSLAGYRVKRLPSHFCEAEVARSAMYHASNDYKTEIVRNLMSEGKLNVEMWNHLARNY